MTAPTGSAGSSVPAGLVDLLAALPEVHLFTIDSVSFLISAACLTVVLRHVPPLDDANGLQPARGPMLELLAGWQRTLQTPVLRDALILRGVCNLAWPAFTLAVPFLVAHRYHYGIGGYGLTLGMFGAGNLLGTTLAARIDEPWLTRTCCLAWIGTGIGFAALAASWTYWAFLVAAFATGICTPLANVTINAHIAATVPQRLLARVYTTQRITVVAASLAGLPLAATLTTRYGPASALYAGALLIAAAGCTALLNAQTRT